MTIQKKDNHFSEMSPENNNFNGLKMLFCPNETQAIRGRHNVLPNVLYYTI